eukprot:9244072-Alexandrium_andersonii.AAC.1
MHNYASERGAREHALREGGDMGQGAVKETPSVQCKPRTHSQQGALQSPSEETGQGSGRGNKEKG